MKNLTKEEQQIAVKKVLEEMNYAEEYVKRWNAYWWEQLLNAHCLPLHYELSEADIRSMEKKYEPRYKLANAFYSEDSIGTPLVTETLIGDNTLTGETNINFQCEFGKIDWYGMTSHKSKRYFSFNNNGDINFSKDVKTKQTVQHPRQISYDTSYNVLSNNFNVNITINQLTQDRKKSHQYDDLAINLNQNIITKRFNDIEIIQDLNTGIKLVKIVKKYDKHNRNSNASVIFEAVLNPDDSLERGAVAINTHKGNKKVNGTYRFDVSRKKGVRANFYSRNGVKTELIKNPMLLKTANALLLPSPNNQKSSDIIVSNFANSTQNTIAKNLIEKEISFDNSDFNMEAIKQAESKIIEMIKCIKGELPLQGLTERINNCLKLMEKQHSSITSDKPKTLKLELPNK